MRRDLPGRGVQARGADAKRLRCCYVPAKDALRRNPTVGTPSHIEEGNEMKGFSRSIRFLAVASAMAVTLSVASFVQPGGADAARAPYCGIRWGSLSKVSSTLTQAPITGARVGRHRCFDRLVIDLSARPAAGFNVRYTTGFYAEGSGAPLLVAGRAILTVAVNAPAYDDDGNPTVTWGPGTVIMRPDQFKSRTLPNLPRPGLRGHLRGLQLLWTGGSGPSTVPGLPTSRARWRKSAGDRRRSPLVRLRYKREQVPRAPSSRIAADRQVRRSSSDG